MDELAVASTAAKFVGALNIALPTFADRLHGGSEGNVGGLYLFQPGSSKGLRWLIHWVTLIILTGSAVLWSPLVANPILGLMHLLKLRLVVNNALSDQVLVVGVLMLLGGLAIDLIKVV